MNEGDATLIDMPSSKLLLRSMQTQEEFPVTGAMTVGRSSASDIHLDDISISRQHARVTRIADAVIVEDLNSTNGTSVNGKKISAPQQLNVGDELRFHKYAFRLAAFIEEEATMLDAQHAAPATDKPEAEKEGVHVMRDAVPDVPVMLDAVPDVPAMLDAVPDVPAMRDAVPDNDASGSSALEEVLRPGADRTQTMSPQKVRLLAQRAALAKSPITTGSGARLVILTAPLRGKVFSLPESLPAGTQVNIGRGGQSNKLNIMLDDKTVSQDHAKLELTPQGWAIKTSNARNAITVNGELASGSSLLHQDTITIGRIELAFLTDEQDDASAMAESNQARRVNKRSTGRRVARVILFMTLAVALILAALFALPIS